MKLWLLSSIATCAVAHDQFANGDVWIGLVWSAIAAATITYPWLRGGR